MPIYEYYCEDNHTIYQFFAKTLAQGQSVPPCPANPKFRMRKLVSTFAVTKGGGPDQPPADVSAGVPNGTEDARMEAAMGAMEKEFARVDENDPRAMARMMRRMAEVTGEKIDAEMEEVVRKLEEGADPESIDEQLGGAGAGDEGLDGENAGRDGPGQGGQSAKDARHRFRVKRLPPRRDPELYDYA
jgi:hypothetical protein